MKIRLEKALNYSNSYVRCVKGQVIDLPTGKAEKLLATGLFIKSDKPVAQAGVPDGVISYNEKDKKVITTPAPDAAAIAAQKVNKNLKKEDVGDVIKKGQDVEKEEFPAPPQETNPPDSPTSPAETGNEGKVEGEGKPQDPTSKSKSKSGGEKKKKKKKKRKKRKKIKKTDK